MSLNDELKHYGVKGMKWGVRKKYVKKGRKKGKEDYDLETNNRPKLSPENFKKKKNIDYTPGESPKKKVKKVKKGKEDYDLETNNRPKLSPENFKKKKNIDYTPGESPKKKVKKEDDKVSSEKQAKREEAAKKYEAKAEKLKENLADLEKDGLKSQTFNRHYGKGSSKMPDAVFVAIYGTSREQALENLKRKTQHSIDEANAAAQAKREGKMTPGQKKALGFAAVVAVAAAGYGIYKHKQNVGREYLSGADFMKQWRVEHFIDSQRFMGSLDDTDIVVPKGTTFKRMSASPEYEVRKNVYAAFTEDDIQRYKGILPTYFHWIDKNDAYQVSLESTAEIKSPSLKKRVDIFRELLETNEKARSRFGVYDTDTKEQIEKIARENYASFAVNDAGKSEIGQIYFKMIEDRGYNAWMDDNDLGTLADMPIVMFNNNNELKRLDAKKIDPSEIALAVTKIRNLAKKRKGK